MELLPGMNKKPKLTIANVFDRDNAKKGLTKNLSFGMTRTSENAKKDIEKNTVIIESDKKICSDDPILFSGPLLHKELKRGKKIHFGRTMHRLPQRLKSTFFEIFSSEGSVSNANWTWSEG